MRCLTYALRTWIRKGGYLCMRRSRSLPIPHFLHAEKLEGCTHMTAVEYKGFWRELWECVTGKGYALKRGDE